MIQPLQGVVIVGNYEAELIKEVNANNNITEIMRIKDVGNLCISSNITGELWKDSKFNCFVWLGIGEEEFQNAFVLQWKSSPKKNGLGGAKIYEDLENCVDGFMLMVLHVATEQSNIFGFSVDDTF